MNPQDLNLMWLEAIRSSPYLSAMVERNINSMAVLSMIATTETTKQEEVKNKIEEKKIIHNRLSSIED